LESSYENPLIVGKLLKLVGKLLKLVGLSQRIQILSL
jgi:hypothetical protein